MKLSVVIVSYNRFDLLAKSLAAVAARPLPFPHEVIVVDNGSQQDVCAFLAERFPDVTAVANRANLGFARANNIGAAQARGEYLLFLNSDAYPQADALERMVAILDAEPDTGVLGPLLLDPGGAFQLSFGSRISLLSELDQKVLAGRRARRRWDLPGNRQLRLEVDWVSGACLLTRRNLFAGGRVFDEEMFLYFEDHELCLRVRAMGRRVVFTSAAVVVHERGGSGGASSPRAQLEYRRSQLHIYRLHAPARDRWLLRLYLRLKCVWLTLAPDRPGRLSQRRAIREAMEEERGRRRGET